MYDKLQKAIWFSKSKFFNQKRRIIDQLFYPGRVYTWSNHVKIVLAFSNILPQANIDILIKTRVSLCDFLNKITKFLYKLTPSQNIQKKVANSKYWIAIAIALQPISHSVRFTNPTKTPNRSRSDKERQINSRGASLLRNFLVVKNY